MPADQAVEALIHEYYKLVFHTIYALTGNWEESQDLTQDTFHQALKAIDAARAASGERFHARAWLLRIALNTVRMQRRRRALFRFVPFSLMQREKRGESGEAGNEEINEQALPVQPGGYGARGDADPAEAVAEQDAVHRTLARLPEPMRVCLLLSIVGGLSTAEIASMLELKEAAVRQRLARARKQFQQLYAHESGEEVLDLAASPHTESVSQHRQQEGAEHQAFSDSTQRLRLTTPPPTTGRSYA